MVLFVGGNMAPKIYGHDGANIFLEKMGGLNVGWGEI